MKYKKKKRGILVLMSFEQKNYGYNWLIFKYLTYACLEYVNLKIIT